MTVVLHYPDVDVEYQEQTSTYLRVLPSYELYGKSRPTYNNTPLALGRKTEEQTLWVYGLPDVWRYTPKSYSNKKPDTIELDYDKQHWLLKIQIDVAMGRVLTKAEYFQWFLTAEKWYAKQLTGSLTHDRSHTNFEGMDTARNYLLNERMDKGLPKFSQIITGGTIMRAVLENGQPTRRNIPSYGACLAFECINSKSDLWQYSPLSHWWLFEQPAISGRVVEFGKGGLRIVRDDLLMPYPGFNERLVFPLWLNQDDIAWIPEANVGTTDATKKEWVKP